MKLTINENYEQKYGFKMPEKPVHAAEPGLSERLLREISDIKKEKNEHSWIGRFRLRSLEAFLKKKMPAWGADFSKINFDDIVYYIKPTEKPEGKWEDLPPEIRNTFDKLGIPQAERSFLAGVGAQYDSDSVYHSIIKPLEEKGVIFVDPDMGLQKYPHIFKKYFGTIVPPEDNKFAALNSATFSGGSFIYIPPGVNVEQPLQAYFRINADRFGQFERTLIIADEGSKLHYIEGCFTKGVMIQTNPDLKPIEEISVGDRVLTHTGNYKTVYRTQVRPYTGNLYKITVYSSPNETIEVTEEHPFLCVKRTLPNERNKNWGTKWVKAKNLSEGDYLVTPRNKSVVSREFVEIEIDDKRKGKKPKLKVKIPSTREFFRLAGYYLAEGSISKGYYLSFSFGSHEKEYIKDVKRLLKTVFGIKKTYDPRHKTNHGISVVVSSVRLARIFESFFGKGSDNKKIPYWMILEDPEKQKELIIGLFRGDGNYYNSQSTGCIKEIFRINTTSQKLAKQVKDVLLRLGVASFINERNRIAEKRKTMYTIGISGEYMIGFGKLIGVKIKDKLNNKKRATRFYIDDNFMYTPIRRIGEKSVKNIPVYNFSVEKDESYVANGATAHNCTSPVYSKDSLHAAVVEIVALPGSHVRYTTLQNWSNNVYNLVTKRAHAYENATVEWVDANIGSKVTTKFPSVYMRGRNAKADILSVAFAGNGQHQDTGGKAIHLAPDTSSRITAKSVSKGDGRTTYRGLLYVAKGASNVKSSVRCDALLLNDNSRTDTYPYNEIHDDTATITHEAAVGKIGEDMLFYLMSRGLGEQEALNMVVMGFFEPFVREIPLEYAIEFNKLIQLEMEGAVG